MATNGEVTYRRIRTGEDRDDTAANAALALVGRAIVAATGGRPAHHAIIAWNMFRSEDAVAVGAFDREGRLIGAASSRGAGNLDYVVIAPDFRRQGVGTALFETLRVEVAPPKGFIIQDEVRQRAPEFFARVADAPVAAND